MRNIDKSKLVLVERDKDERIMDQALETKEIGYYQDSWNRFKKNKASLVAFIIINIIMFFVLFGPHMKVYKLPNENKVEAERLSNLTPKMPLLEKVGIFDGTKTIRRGRRFLKAMHESELGQGIILSELPEGIFESGESSNIEVKVDYYKYVNFVMSYMPEDYYSTLDRNEKEGLNLDPLSKVTRKISSEQFEEYLEKNYIIDVRAVEVDSETGEKVYSVRYDQFKVALDQLPEDTYFWWGTNQRGEDLFLEVWKGARISLIMAVSVLIINYTVGLIIGSIVGYYGGVLDLLFDRLVEIITSIPFLSVLMLLTLRFGNSTWVIVLAFTATGWIGPYGTGRMQFYRFKNREYVLAARTLGASDKRIMFKHIFPNTLGLIITGMALAIPSFVFTESSYAFLDIIKYDNATSVGMLIQEGQGVMRNHPHLIFFPALYIAILMITFNLFGNGLRDAFNPSLRGAE